VRWATTIFTDKGVEVFRREDSSIVFMGRLKNKLYLVDFKKGKVVSAFTPDVGFG
jgi:hypothetical protein